MGDLVSAERLELSRRKAYAPKAYVYTNFTTRTYYHYITFKRAALGGP